MTHERDGDRDCFCCDGCPETYEGEPGDRFGVVWAEAKAAGWVVFKVDDEFRHRCPACAEED